MFFVDVYKLVGFCTYLFNYLFVWLVAIFCIVSYQTAWQAYKLDE